jgi:glycerate-2-kinase
LAVTVLDLANSLLVFVILVVGGTSALFLIREGIELAFRRRR